MKIISRQKALALSLKRYFTGRPCKRGHISERTLPKSECLVCRKNWQRANAGHLAELRAKYVKNNREKCILNRKKWYRRKMEHLRKDPIALDAFRAAANKRCASWRRRNPDKNRSTQAKFDAKRKGRGKKAYFALRVLRELGIEI